MNARSGSCWHCGEPLPAGLPIQARVGGASHPVCCQGCRAAAEWIDQLGLADYYRVRREPAPRPEPAATNTSLSVWEKPELTRHVVRRLDEERREAVVLVEGVRCSACAWLIERSLAALPGIINVRVNPSAHRARIVWREPQCSLAQAIEALTRIGYRALPLDAAALDDARKHESHAALKRLIVAGFGAMQAMMYAAGVYLDVFDGMDASTRDLLRLFGMLVATPVVFYSAQPFFAGALRSLRARVLGLDVPVALAVALIYAASVVETLRGGQEVYFDSVSMFVFFLLVGRYLEMRARHRAGDLSDALVRLTPMHAERIEADGQLRRVAALDLRPDDRVHVAEGGTVPADGALLSERCLVDEALLSGESTPVLRRRGDTLVAGSIVVEGPARMQVERIGADTVLAGVLALITRATAERPRLAQAGERAAAGFVARVLALTAFTAIGWGLIDPSHVLTATLAVLVVSCPCAFALAVPAAFTRAIAVLAQRGVLVVRPDAIESLAGATHMVFDKTGTLTDARLTLERVEPLRGDEPEAVLALAAALARGSRHPVAQSIAGAAPAASRLGVADVRAQAGGGLEGFIDGRTVRLGRPDFALGESDIPPGLEDTVVLADADGAIAAFHLSERLRPGAQTAVSALTAQGLTLEIASGDAHGKVADIARRLGLDRWHARLRPEDKLNRLQALRANGARVVAVGDGINDAPVLAGADVSIALAAGADLAQASSDIVLAGERLDLIAWARGISRETLKILRQNQRWALCYNLLAIPFAALGFVPPWLAAIGMSVSSLFVVLNALRIGRRRGQAALTNTIAPREAPA